MSSSIQQDKRAQNEESSSLPLGWTKVKRKRQAAEEQCCPDPETCCRRPQMYQPLVTVQEKTKDSLPMLKGHVVFCLHEMDPSWLQGYFVPRGSTRPHGLLAVQEDVDDCMACQDGGFRRVSLTVFRKGEKSIKFQNIDWTGGDMMRLHHSRLEMEADRLWTGPSALPFVEQYFQGLIGKLRSECDIEADVPILDWLPEIAVVVGEMTLVLEKGDSNSIDSGSSVVNGTDDTGNGESNT